jgi:hypothetical protein
MIEKTPSLGTQVEYLELHGDFDEDYSVAQLLHFFPHLYGIKILLDLSKDAQIVTFNTNEESISLPSQIEFIKDGVTGEVMREMTEIGFFCHLVSLKLNLRHVFTSDEMSSICHQIANMPVLKQLEIANFSLKPSHCEFIHTQIPSLTSLGLYTIENSEENLPIDIQPATSITNLTIDLTAFTVEEQNK